MAWLIAHPPVLPIIFMGYSLIWIFIFGYSIWKEFIK